MKLRRQLPAYSPIRFVSMLAGITAAVGLGRPRERLRDRLETEYGTPDLLLTDSGTSALRLAIRGALRTDARDGDGTEGLVALPAYCCFDVATAAIGAGARVCLYDVEPDTLGPDWDSLEAALWSGASAVVAVHLYGIPIDMERARKLCDAHGAVLIEDAAQGFGGRIGDRPLGAFGSLGVLSFGRGKGVTGGGGGALLANDAVGRSALEGARRGRGRGGAGWGELARLAAQWLLGRPSLYGLPASLPWLGLGETMYAEPWPPGDIARGPAAALLANWDASVEEVAARRANAARLRSVLGGRASLPESCGAATAGALRQPVLLTRESALAGEAADLRTDGVAPGYPSLPDLPALRFHLASRAPFPNAALLVEGLWTLPTHSLADVEVTAAALGRCLPG